MLVSLSRNHTYAHDTSQAQMYIGATCASLGVRRWGNEHELGVSDLVHTNEIAIVERPGHP